MSDSIVVTDEMRQAVRAERCGSHGHSFDVVTTATLEPVSLHCPDCGRSWKVGDAR